VTAAREADDVVISVRDSGVGIPPECLPSMFELFAQEDRSLARSEGGLGIGLTVAKTLVEMHAGEIVAFSAGRGCGSEFTVRLPAAKAPTKALTTPRAPSEIRREYSRANGSRILVVDDNVDTAKTLAKLLSLAGHEVRTAYNGPDGLEIARSFSPEFVMLDIGLPGMDGYEVAANLRAEPCGQNSTIVAISGYGAEEDRHRSGLAGFDHHLVKPVNHEALLGLLKSPRRSDVHPDSEMLIN
jgi:CheY-like chemotaxis protein